MEEISREHTGDILLKEVKTDQVKKSREVLGIHMFKL